MYITFEFICIMVLTFIHQDLLVHASVNGSCVELYLEPRDIISNGERVKVTFINPDLYVLKIVDIYFYEPKRGRLNCTDALQYPANTLSCTTKRSDVKSYPYNTSVDFVLTGECRDPWDNSFKGFIQVNSTNYINIIDPVIDCVSPHTIFSNQPILVMFQFKEIHPKHLKTLYIFSNHLECEGTRLINKGARTRCKATKVPSSERVLFRLDSRGIVLFERWIPFVTKPTSNKIIEPIFGESCHPIHINGQNLNDTGALETIDEEIHANLIQGITTVGVNQNYQPSIKFAVYSLQKLTIHLVNYDQFFAEITEIQIFDASSNESIPCSYKLTINSQNISCISETKVAIELWSDYIIFKIGLWETHFYCIQTSEPKANIISFIITVLIFLFVVGLACILVCGCTGKSMEDVKSGIQVWRSSASSIDSNGSYITPPKRAIRNRRTYRSYSTRRMGKLGPSVPSGLSSIPS